ncbi:NAD-dependent epimerase/dehydratase family protein [Streptomyces durbertensis]|uniref:NAD-dependent epimerase/dehydratase family protein n=1 Tax=Streptomyces durbertensis TaxID=2448886 RepID=A0ABR6E9K4_9ACTN|nr:NAD-dependent epimerase/dehydratase family protein [Streptomyces durbertensis]
MDGPLLLVTGGTGFVGGAVAAAVRATPGARLRLASRRPSAASASAGRTIRADLTDPASLRGLCDGVDVLLHCATRIEGPADLTSEVNDRGTEALVEEALRAGVRRIVYLSTASVYGRGTFRDVRPESLPLAPGSPTSASRAAAEAHVLAAGGTTLRPHLITGAGDRWVVPGLVRLHRRLLASVDGWPARISTVDVADLARVAVALALAPEDVSGAWHPNHPEPVRCDELFDALVHTFRLPPTHHDLSIAAARGKLADHPRDRHHLDMLATDHWFDSTRPWSVTGSRPGLGFVDSLHRHASWYQAHLATALP